MSAIKTKSFDRRGREVTMTVPLNDEQAERFNKADANEAYQAEKAKTVALLRRVAEQYKGHEAKQKQDPKNWGYVGDLQHMNSLLKQMLGED